MEVLASRLRGAKRAAVMGVGSYLRGDDAAGLRVARRLKRAAPLSVLVLECSTVPESFTDKVRAFGADHVIVVDAVRAGLEPGSVVVLEPSQVRGEAWETHSPSLRLLADYLEREVGAKVTLVGIQAKELGLAVGGRMTKEVARAADALARALAEAFEEVGLGGPGAT